MRIVITGDRNWSTPTHHRRIAKAILRRDPQDVEFVLGDARGVDSIARDYCQRFGYRYVVKEADWKKYGPAAGPKRNAEMLDPEPDLVEWFHDDLASSKGTKDCVSQANAMWVPTLRGF